MKKLVLLALVVMSANTFAVVEAVNCNVRLVTDAYYGVAANALSSRGYTVTDDATATVTLVLSKDRGAHVVIAELDGLENFRGDTLFRQAGAIRNILRRAVKDAASRLEACVVRTSSGNEAAERIRRDFVRGHADL